RRDAAGDGAGGPVAAGTGSASEAGRNDQAAAIEKAPRRRPRRSAHREAGPPDSVLAPGTATTAEAKSSAEAPSSAEADSTPESEPGNDAAAATGADENQEEGVSPGGSSTE